MSSETVVRAARIIGEIQIALKNIGITPATKLTNRMQGNELIYTVTLDYHDAFERKHLTVSRDAIEAPEYALQYALEDFWKKIMEELHAR